MAIEIRSYRSVFDLERRIYRIDRLRLNPGGIPVRGVVYFLALLAAAFLAAKLPGVAVVPWYLREIALPAAFAALLSAIRIEGRPFHLSAVALMRFATTPRHLTGAGSCPPRGQRWHPQEILVLPDGSDWRLRRVRYTGPGAVLVTIAHERAEWGRRLSLFPARRMRLTIRELPGLRALSTGRAIALGPGTRLDVLAKERRAAVRGAHRPS